MGAYGVPPRRDPARDALKHPHLAFRNRLGGHARTIKRLRGGNDLVPAHHAMGELAVLGELLEAAGVGSVLVILEGYRRALQDAQHIALGDDATCHADPIAIRTARRARDLVLEIP